MTAGASAASRLPAVADARRATLVAGAALGLAATAIAAATALDAATHPALVAVARAGMVAVPIAVGLYAWYARLDERFGLLLAAAGAGWFLTTLAESPDAGLYTLGRAAGWTVEVLLAYLFLAFPSGRLSTRADRALVAAMGAVMLVLFLPRLLLASSFEVPSPYTSCVRDCPGNALFALDAEPAVLTDVLRPLGVVAVCVVMAAIALRLAWRMRAAPPLTARLLTPVLAVAIGRTGLLAVAIAARAVDPSSRLLRIAAWLLALAVPLIALAFLVGLLRWRLFSGRALERLASCVRARPDAATLERAFGDAFEDPSAAIALPAGPPGGERWVGADGAPVVLPRPGRGLAVSRVEGEGGAVAAIVHDEALTAHPALLRAGVELAGVALENQRLAAEAETAMRDVTRSRARIAASAERERRRIERDLHDGAQQRLVALRIELGLARELVARDPSAGDARLCELERALDDALEELRALAHGVYPPLLADHGLAEALRAVADRSAIPVELRVRLAGRCSSDVEGAVYFCVVEALQNVLKHAGARRAAVELDGGRGGELRFAVRDDGAGFAPAAADGGVGITNMRDRLAALGGELHVASAPGAGTCVRGAIPTGGPSLSPGRSTPTARAGDAS